jgi:iron(III) transport system permease protein
MAWAVSRTDMPLRGLIRGLTIIPFVIPSFISVIAWILLLGPNAGKVNLFIRNVLGLGITFNIFSKAGLVFVLTMAFYPIVFYAVSAALENMDPSYEEAAMSVGARPWQLLLTTTVPLIYPAILAGAMLVALDAMVAFGAPAVIGYGANFHTMTTKIYTLFQWPPRFELAAACAAPLIFFTMLLLIVQNVFLGKKRFTTITGKSVHRQVVDVGVSKYLLMAFCLLMLFISVFLPILTLLVASISRDWTAQLVMENMTLDHYRQFFDMSSPAPISVRNSFLLAVGTAIFATTIAMVIAWIVERTQIFGRGILSFLNTVTFGFPSIALGVGLVIGYMHPPLALYGTLWLFLIGYITKYMPFGFVFSRSALKQVVPELEEAARTVGASWSRTMLDVTAPLLKNGVIGSLLVIFSVSLRELGMSILLFMPGTETLSVTTFLYLYDGHMGPATAVAVGIVTICLVSLFLMRRLTGRGPMEM